MKSKDSNSKNSFGMTTTKTLRSVFSWRASYCIEPMWIVSTVMPGLLQCVSDQLRCKTSRPSTCCHLLQHDSNSQHQDCFPILDISSHFTFLQHFLCQNGSKFCDDLTKLTFDLDLSRFIKSYSLFSVERQVFYIDSFYVNSNRNWLNSL